MDTHDDRPNAPTPNQRVESGPRDGRGLRTERTRAAIIAAWVGMIDDGELSPTARAVADRAGVGLRTVFQHFADMNALHHAAGEGLMAKYMPVSTDLPPMTLLADRIGQTVVSRSAIWESLTPLRRACERQEWVSTDIRGIIDRCELNGSDEARRVFRTEIDACSDDLREPLTFAVDAMLSWSTWNHLRQRRSLGIESSQAVVRDGLGRLLH